jgi:hypothetical protein
MKTAVARKQPAAPAQSALEQARALGLVGAIKSGPSDMALRHSRYLKSKIKAKTKDSAMHSR